MRCLFAISMLRKWVGFFLVQKVRIPIYPSNWKRKKRILILIFFFDRTHGGQMMSSC